MDNLKLFISLPFRTEGTPDTYPDAVFQFDVRIIRRYLQALQQEIESAAYDMEDCLVTEIEFGIGSYCHLLTTDVEALYRLICRKFRVSQKVRVKLHATPAGFDFYRMTAARHMNMAQICFDLPSMDALELQKAGFRMTPDGIRDALNGCFQNAYHHLAFTVSPKHNPTEAMLCDTVTELLRCRPEEIRFAESPTESQMVRLRELLLPVGYTEASGCFWKEGYALPQTPDLQIGCGLNAVTRMDQTVFRTTSDLEFYCEHPTEFELLAEQV